MYKLTVMKLKIYLAMLFIGGASYCFAQSATTEPSKDEFITKFMYANTSHDVATLDKLMANNVKISIPGKGDPISLNKKEYLQLMSQMGKDQQECNCSHKILKSDTSTLIAEMYFVYSTYAIQNSIKAEIKSGKWKVTELVKSFISAQSVIVNNP